MLKNRNGNDYAEVNRRHRLTVRREDYKFLLRVPFTARADRTSIY